MHTHKNFILTNASKKEVTTYKSSLKKTPSDVMQHTHRNSYYFTSLLLVLCDLCTVTGQGSSIYCCLFEFKCFLWHYKDDNNGSTINLSLYCIFHLLFPPMRMMTNLVFLLVCSDYCNWHHDYDHRAWCILIAFDRGTDIYEITYWYCWFRRRVHILCIPISNVLVKIKLKKR